jgi:hypothetical protein
MGQEAGLFGVAASSINTPYTGNGVTAVDPQGSPLTGALGKGRTSFHLDSADPEPSVAGLVARRTE